MPEKKRLQFDFTEESLRELDELREITGLPTRAELVRHALRLLQWTIDETKNKGATILLEKEGKIREVVFPFWGQPGRSMTAEAGSAVIGSVGGSMNATVGGRAPLANSTGGGGS